MICFATESSAIYIYLSGNFFTSNRDRSLTQRRNCKGILQFSIYKSIVKFSFSIVISFNGVRMARSLIHNFVKQNCTSRFVSILDHLKNIFTSWAKRNRRKEGRKEEKANFQNSKSSKSPRFFEKIILTRESVSMLRIAFPLQN